MNIGIETELVEFKKTTGELKEGIVSLASMLNKNGKGILYFGVRNDGEVVGQQIGDRTMREISQGIAHAIRPQIIPTIIMELCDDKNVIKVTATGDERPYSAFGKYYIRSADEDREISPPQDVYKRQALQWMMGSSLSSPDQTAGASPPRQS